MPPIPPGRASLRPLRTAVLGREAVGRLPWAESILMARIVAEASSGPRFPAARHPNPLHSIGAGVGFYSWSWQLAAVPSIGGNCPVA